MPRSRYKVVQAQTPHFLTMTINNWLPVFTRPETVNIIFQSWRYLQHQADFKLYAYVILENHLHCVAASENLAADVQRFKSYTAREIIAYLQATNAQRLLDLLKFFKRAHKTQSTYQLWEEGSHPQLIESESVMRQKVDYIHYNPVKRGYVDKPEDWRYSSARVYAGQPGLMEVECDW